MPLPSNRGRASESGARYRGELLVVLHHRAAGVLRVHTQHVARVPAAGVDGQRQRVGRGRVPGVDPRAVVATHAAVSAEAICPVADPERVARDAAAAHEADSLADAWHRDPDAQAGLVAIRCEVGLENVPERRVVHADIRRRRDLPVAALVGAELAEEAHEAGLEVLVDPRVAGPAKVEPRTAARGVLNHVRPQQRAGEVEAEAAADRCRVLGDLRFRRCARGAGRREAEGRADSSRCRHHAEPPCKAVAHGDSFLWFAGPATISVAWAVKLGPAAAYDDVGCYSL